MGRKALSSAEDGEEALNTKSARVSNPAIALQDEASGTCAGVGSRADSKRAIEAGESLGLEYTETARWESPIAEIRLSTQSDQPTQVVWGLSWIACLT